MGLWYAQDLQPMQKPCLKMGQRGRHVLQIFLRLWPARATGDGFAHHSCAALHLNALMRCIQVSIKSPGSSF